MNRIRSHAETMSHIVSIRHSVMTLEELYKAEKDILADLMPELQGFSFSDYQSLVSSPFRLDFENYSGRQLFALAECQRKNLFP